MEYWFGVTRQNRVFIAQKKCLRAIFDKHWSDSCRPIFKSQGLLTMPSTYFFETTKFVKSNMHLFDVADNTHKRKYIHMFENAHTSLRNVQKELCVHFTTYLQFTTQEHYKPAVS